MPIPANTHRTMVTIPDELLYRLREKLSHTDRFMAVAPLSTIIRYLAAKEAGIPDNEIVDLVYLKQGPKPKAREGATN